MAPQQTLRISASRAAAAAGIHPFADAGELFLELLYQDLPELLLHDAQIVGADVVGPLQAREELLTKSGEMPTFEEALQGAQAAESVQAIWEAQRLVREASAAAEKSGRLSTAEAEELQKGLEAELNQGFGSKHESSALSRYALQQGCQVHSCGMRVLLAMPEAGPGEALASTLPAMSGFRADLAQQEADESGYFLLSGYVDALAELPGPEGPETVVVEVKHPIGRIKVPPNIYDVVQLGTYCRLLGLRQGHLVQCLRQDGREGRLHITKMDFSEGQTHRKGWDSSVLPSMYKLVAAVYAARQDVALRQRLLASSPQERTSLVEGLCPHLER